MMQTTPKTPNRLAGDESAVAIAVLGSIASMAQTLARMLEDAAQREGRRRAPGLMMLGNRVFAQGCGVAMTEEYRRWVDRLLINGTLEGPSVADCAAVAANMAPTLARMLEDAAQREAAIEEAVGRAVADGQIVPAARDLYIMMCRQEGGLEAFRKLIADVPAYRHGGGGDAADQ
jgi:hypothetical protein